MQFKDITTWVISPDHKATPKNETKCDHLTGTFVELILGTHSRQVENGVLDVDSFNNEYDGGLGHEYHCKCGKTWKWRYRPRQKWLDELFTNAYKTIENHAR